MTATVTPETAQAAAVQQDAGVHRAEAARLRTELDQLQAEYAESRRNAERVARLANEQAAELGAAQRTTADLRAQQLAQQRLIEELRGQHTAAAEELDNFKRRVVDVALEMARRHNMCRVVQDTLTDELGLELPTTTYIITVEFVVEAAPNDGNRDRSEEYVRRSIRDASISLDSDFTEEVVDYDVTDVSVREDY